MAQEVQVVATPAIETFRLLQRVSELVKHGEISPTTAAYILDTPLDVIGAIQDWMLPPCMVNPIVERYCEDSVRKLLTPVVCSKCGSRAGCRKRVDIDH